MLRSKRQSWRTPVLAASLCAAVSGVAGPLLACGSPPARAPLGAEGAEGADWNAAVGWREYAAGLAEAKQQGRPVLLVFYTDWCPHCHNYSRLFHDPEVVRLSRAFVMVRVERDANRDISQVYAIDGDYIPRTFFLAPSGAVLSDLTGDNEEFRYFFDEHDPTELLAMMQRALERLGVPEPTAT